MFTTAHSKQKLCHYGQEWALSRGKNSADALVPNWEI